MDRVWSAVVVLAITRWFAYLISSSRRSTFSSCPNLIHYDPVSGRESSIEEGGHEWDSLSSPKPSCAEKIGRPKKGQGGEVFGQW